MKVNKVNFLLFFLLICILIFILLIGRIDHIIQRTLATCQTITSKTKSKITSSFPTHVYELLLSGYLSKDNTLVFDKRYPNQLHQFKEDVKGHKINMIVINSYPYLVQFKKEDDFYVYFITQNMCHVMNLYNCTTSGLEYQNMMLHFVHVLGFYLDKP